MRVQPGVEVKLAEHSDGGGSEPYVLCRSGVRLQKEPAMLAQQLRRLRAWWKKTDAGLRKRPAQDLGATERRIGRWLGRYPDAERLLMVKEDATVRSMDVELPVKSGSDQTTELRLRVMACPDRMVAALLCRLGRGLPNAPRIGQNGVPKTTLRRPAYPDFIKVSLPTLTSLD